MADIMGGKNIADGSLIFDTGLNTNGISNGFTGITSMAVSAAATITTAFAAASAAAIKVGADFTSSMSQVAATMAIDQTSAEYKLLNDAAKEMGATTKYTASQAAEALNYLALAGYNAEQSVSTLPTVLNVATAGGMDLAYASDMITDSMSALGLEMDELDAFANQLAVTAQKSNTSVSQLGEAILTIGGTAKSLSGGTTELNTMLGILADNGIKASEGGTALRNVILSLSAPTDTAAATLDNLCVSAFDANGNMRSLSDVFVDLNAALAPLTEQEKTQALNDIFNKVDLKSVNALLGTSAERFEELEGYISNCDGAASQMAETMADNLTGDLATFNSALEGLGIAVYSKFESPMRSAIQYVTEDISSLITEVESGGLSDSFEKISTGAESLITTLADLAANNAIPTIINGLAAIVDHGDSILAVIAGITTAVAGIKLVPIITSLVAAVQTANLQVAMLSAQFGTAAVASTALGGGLTATEIVVSLLTGKITLATAAQTAWNAVVSANPFMLLVSALAIAVTAIGLIIANVNKAKDATDDLTDSADDYVDAMEKVRETSQDEIDSTNAEIGVIKEKAARYEELRQRYENLTTGEMAEFLSLCDDLKDVLPEGTMLIDEQTGAYLNLADSIDKVCTKMESQAVLNAKYSEYEEAAAQNYDIERQLDEIQRQYDIAMGQADLYAAEGLDVKSTVSMDTLAQKLYGTSYDNLVKLQAQNQQIIDDYHQLYSDTYEAINDDTGIESYSDGFMSLPDVKRQEQENIYANYSEDMKAYWEEQTAILEDEWKVLDHEYNTGIITDESELYSKRKELLKKYGNSTLEEHWTYYEDLYAYEKQYNEDQLNLIEESAEKQAELEEDMRKKALENLKDDCEDKLSVVKENISDMLAEYKSAMADLQSNIEGYKNKLLSVGDIFTSSVTTDDDGNEVHTYTVENLSEQMEQMQKYHDYIKQLKASGASDALLSELTSLDFDEGYEFAKYLTSMSADEFDQINQLYSEKLALADELSQDLYASEAATLNDALVNCVQSALETLPEQAQAAGKTMLQGFISGLSSTDDLSEEITAFSDGFAEIYESAIEEIDLENGFNIALSGLNAYSKGQSLAQEFSSGFTQELARVQAEISANQQGMAFEISSGESREIAKDETQLENQDSSVTVDVTVTGGKITLDGKAVGEYALDYTQKSIVQKGS